MGVGGSARVYKGKYNDENVAVKLLYCIEITRTVVLDFFSESRVLMKLCDSHPNIIKINGVCIAPPALGIVLELCNESLFNKLSRQPQVSTSEFLRLAIDCTRAVKYLHSRQPPLCHRDIKSLNFLMKNNVVKLADMGLTRSTIALRNKERNGNEKYGSVNGMKSGNDDRIAGTLQWAAPEVISKDSYTEHSDVYSLAIVLWEILTGNIPYESDGGRKLTSSAIENYIMSGGRPRIPYGTNETIKKLLESMWCQNPLDRISANDAMDILKSLLKTKADIIHIKKYDIIAAIADPLNQLIGNRRHYGVQYRNCFVGSAVLKFLVESNIVQNKEEGLLILNIMLKNDKTIQHVTNEHDFKDEYLFYVLKK